MPIPNTEPKWLQWTPEERIDNLAGQVEALYALLRGLIASHPDVTALRTVFLGGGQLQAALALNSPMSERFIEGQDLTRSRVSALLEEKRQFEIHRLAP